MRAIYVAPSAAAPPGAVPETRALAGRGLEGDRYARSAGSFSRWPGSGRAVSLIEEEAIDAVFREHGIDLGLGRHRRNLVTRGVRLPDLVGRRFRVGRALFRGERLCLPCRHVEKLTEPGVYAALKGRGGLRADVLEEGLVRAGDLLTDLGDRRPYLP